MNFVFISPNFPRIYSHFVKALKDKGIKVFGIGDEPFDCLDNELKWNLTEYCFVSDLSNLDWMKNAIDYLQSKYGHLDYIESNNEFWLMSDAELRKHANVTTGMWPEDMNHIKFKSEMKEYFVRAGVKVARYIIVDNLEQTREFVKVVGFPVFAKPDNGVGAAETFKINNDEDLVNFINNHPNEPYIMEEYLDGYIVSFDGICDQNSDVVMAVMETFPKPIAEVVKEDSDVWYYAQTKMPSAHMKRGKAVIKSFGIKQRCFHIEFFVLDKDKEGLGKKGDFIGLEVNMRSPGGNTPNLICIALQASYYDIYAKMIADEPYKQSTNNMIAIAVSRKDRFQYTHTHEEIMNRYGWLIKEYGDYPPAISKVMGNHFYFGEFNNLKDAIAFKDYIEEYK